jgi:hypothetical protein
MQTRVTHAHAQCPGAYLALPKKHPGTILATLALVISLYGCAEPADEPLVGRPGGPYRLVLSTEPAQPLPGEETWLEFALTYSASGKPVTDLQLAHERLMHNFITDLGFASFAHIHHEDFAPVSDAERRAGRLRFPYRFPRAGQYRIVSEFAHRDRNWVKQFDVRVGDQEAPPLAATADLARERRVGDFTARLQLGPEVPRAGSETDLTLQLERDGQPVTDLALYLGTELHGAVWREDGRNFGHLHSYTPRVAAIIDLAHDRGVAPAARGARIAEMMVQLMCLEAELVFNGPDIPMRYVFPQAGRYHVFLQVAPGGVPVVFPFVIDVVAAGAAADAS